MKFSGSVSRVGVSRTIPLSRVNRAMKPVICFVEKYVWKGVLSNLDSIPVGFLDPVWWRKNRCIIDRAAMMNGNRKWKAKNRVRVALSTENPPQSHCTIDVPMYGTAEISFVITVAPQKDICPQGSTYPTNAVSMVSRRRITPIFHVSLFM